MEMTDAEKTHAEWEDVLVSVAKAFAGYEVEYEEKMLTLLNLLEMFAAATKVNKRSIKEDWKPKQKGYLTADELHDLKRLVWQELKRDTNYARSYLLQLHDSLRMMYEENVDMMFKGKVSDHAWQDMRVYPEGVLQPDGTLKKKAL